MEEFYTRKSANEGVKLPLETPDGKKTEHWILVRGIDSDEFRVAEAISKRKAMEIALLEDSKEKAQRVREVEVECIASLVINWSFEKPCTPKNVCDFFTEAPQIADAINRFAAKRGAFYQKKSQPSTNGLKQKSPSKRPRAKKQK